MLFFFFGIVIVGLFFGNFYIGCYLVIGIVCVSFYGYVCCVDFFLFVLVLVLMKRIFFFW